MKETPITFNQKMVRSILDGRKTQTRRVIKPQPKKENFNQDIINFCPYGKPGDRIWIQEEWAVLHSDDHLKPNEITRREKVFYSATDRGNYLWRYSRNMPRWASRILLEIVSIRVERLNDLSEQDAIAEGFYATQMDFYEVSARKKFSQFWNDCYSYNSWDLNPWVWAIEFKRVFKGDL